MFEFVAGIVVGTLTGVLLMCILAVAKGNERDL
jgi:hypothetical protein